MNGEPTAPPETGERELLPCPFCGETPDVNDPRTFQDSQGTKWGAVVCCCTGPEVRTGYQSVEHWRADAIAAWNLRARLSTESRDPDVASAAVEACRAAVAYDNAIRGCADDPESMASFCTATGDTLDSLYFDWMTKARRVIGEPGEPAFGPEGEE